MTTQAETARLRADADRDVRCKHLIVTWHYIRERNTDGVTGVTPATFRQQLRSIAEHYRIVSASEFASLRDAEPGLALLTFDDAVRDQWTAAEILNELHMPGVFFAPMRPYSDERDRWCAQHLLHSLAEHLGWDELQRRAWPHLQDCAIDEARMNELYHYEVPRKRRLKYALAFAVEGPRAAAILRAINADVGLSPDDWYLSRDQLAQLQADGHDLGGHGFDHMPYSELTADQQRSDMARAVETMNRHFGERSRPLAYPFGRYDATTEHLAREFGYTMTLDTAERTDANIVLDVLARREQEAGT